MNSIETNFNNVKNFYKHLSLALARASDELVDKKGNEFWVRYHGYGLFRICYVINDHYSDSRAHDFKKFKSLKIFEFYDQVRDFYQFDIHGRDQLEFLKLDKSITLEILKNLSLIRHKQNIFNFKDKVLSNLKKILNFLFFSLSFIHSIRTVIIRSSISKMDKFKLFVFSGFKVTPFYLDFPICKNSIDKNLRLKILELVKKDLKEHYDDDFIDYTIKILFISLPTSTIEDYRQIKSYISASFLASLGIKYIVNESITSDHEISIVSALVKEQSATELVYHEHNKLVKVFKYNTLSVIANLVDVFLTHGWDPDNDEKKFIKSSSRWRGFKSITIKKDIKRWALFITGVGYLYETEFSNSSLSHSAQYLENYLTQRDDIFCSMDRNLLKRIDYKPYDRSPWPLTVDIDDVAHKNKLNILDPKTRLSSIYKNYELIIVDYLSTAYIEILISNQPVVVLWNGPANEPNDEAKLLLDDLFKCGVFQRSGKSLGNFVQSIRGKEEIWWNSSEVTKSVKKFLDFYVSYNNDLLQKIIAL